MNNKAIVLRTRGTVAANESSSYYSIPRMKSKYVICVRCNHRFHLPEIVAEKPALSGSYIPLVLTCGHPICSGCAKTRVPVDCPLCNKAVIINENEKLPLNLYTIGLIFSSSQRPIENNDEDFTFHQTYDVAVQLRQAKNPGYCRECGGSASVKCLQCVLLYCYCCYSKIHGRALQSHTHIPIKEGENYVTNVANNCSPTCIEALSYFCNDCDMAGCSNCMLRLHKKHDYVTLQEKNEDMMTEFNLINCQLLQNLQQTMQTKQNLKSVVIPKHESQDITQNIEATISQHFAHLHGLLQSLEMRLLDKLYQRRDQFKNNLMNLMAQLQAQEEQLGAALTISSYASNNFGRVDIREIMKILRKMTNLPCHLVRENTKPDETVTFIVDDSIVRFLENHCSLIMPSISYYSLMRTEELPKDYIIEPLEKDFLIARMFPKSSPSTSSTTVTSVVPIAASPAKSKKDEADKDVNRYQVEITYVVNPSLFYVRKLEYKSKFAEFEKDLIVYGESSNESPIEIKQNDICIVKQHKNLKWYRGHVIAIDMVDDETVYTVFYVDYGYEERRISVSRIQHISDNRRFLTFPPQAIRCSLYGVTPRKKVWSNASTNDFMKLAMKDNCPISIHIIKSTLDILYVDICIPSSKGNSMGPQSMCNAMIYMKHAYSEGLKDVNSQVSYVYNREELLLNKLTEVSITYVESPDSIYVAKTGQRELKFSKIFQDLNEYYKKDTSTKMIDVPRKGLPCVAQKSGIWHRGEIVEIFSENKVKVFYVDIGCSLIVDCNALQVIPYKYTMFKAQAIKISLMYILPESNGDWKPEAIETLHKNILDCKFATVLARKRIENGYAGIITIDTKDGIYDISRMLKSKNVVNSYQLHDRSFQKFKRNFVVQKKLSESVKEFSYSFTDDPEEDKPNEENETIKDPFKMEVCIQRVITPDCIYVSRADYQHSNAKLINDMQKFYDKYYSESRDDWSEGSLCVAYSAKDKSYLRAKILKIKSPMEVLVYLHDMGIEEIVTMKDIQSLHENFTKKPTFCFKVKLAGILPCGGSSVWPLLSRSTLSDIIQENARCKFYITKLVKEECDETIPVILWVKQIKVPGPLVPSKIEINSINRMLVEKGVALPIKDYSSKADEVLVAEFKQQLEDNYRLVPTSEKILWFSKGTCVSIDNETFDLTHESDSDIDICQSTNECTDSVKISNWLPPTEIADEVFRAKTTYVDNNCVLYLHSIKHNAETLEFIESELQRYFKSDKVKKEKEWKEGDLCIAQYHCDKRWYRGRVIQNLGNILQVEFVDYGNIEECEVKYVTNRIRLEHIPIQCTRCVISGLKPKSNKWMLHDLDRIHALLVDKECEVCILQRHPTYLVVSIKLLSPFICELRKFLLNHLNMSIMIEPKEWNDSKNSVIEVKSDTTNSVIIEEILNEKSCIYNASIKSLSHLQDVIFKKNLISGNSVEPLKSDCDDDEEIADFENVSSIIDLMMSDEKIFSSTPQNESQEDNFFGGYKSLSIPQDTKYIELMLCCNIDSTTSYAQLAKNDDDMFSDVLHDHYLQYNAIMSDLQTSASSQPLIECFEKNTPCVTKFTDNIWYRCVILYNNKHSNTQNMEIMLHYIDYGNTELVLVDISENHNLRVPREEWLELPAIAIVCKFWEIDFISNDENLLASKLNEIYNQVVVARVKEICKNFVVAEIYKDKECKELLYTNLIEAGLYRKKSIKRD